MGGIALAGQQGGARAGSDGGAPPMQMMMEKREALLKQCPVPAPVPQSADKLPIATTRWGSVGPQIVLIHGGVQGGLGGGPVTWDKQEALASRGWRVVRVDRPGFGRSPSRGVDDMERDSAWIAEMLGDGSNLIGHSWGGAEALLAAARRLKAVHALILVEPALTPMAIGAPEMRSPEVAADAMKVPGFLFSSATPADYGRKFAGSLGAVPEKESTAAASALSDPVAAASLGCSLLRSRMASPDEMREAARVVHDAGVPVLVITGGWSPSIDATGDVVARLTGGRHVIVRSPNHFVQQSSATAFNDEVDTFLREAGKAHRQTPKS